MYTEEGRSFEDEIFRLRRDFTVDYVSRNYGKDAKLCDLGCGAGPAITELLTRGYDTVGFDYSEDMLRNAKRRLADNGITPAPIARADIQAVPLPDESIDCAVCLGVISYVERYENIIKEIRRVLRPGGTAIITYRNRSNLTVSDPVGPFRYLAGRLRRLFGGGPKQFQIGRYMNIAEVRDAIRNGGLTIVAFEGIGFGPLRFNQKPLTSHEGAIKLDRKLTRWMKALGADFAFRLGTDVHIFVVRKDAAPSAA